MRDVLKKLRPDRFEDIIAVVALYRPGPMDNIPSYIRRKHGEESAATCIRCWRTSLRKHTARNLSRAGDGNRPYCQAIRLGSRLTSPRNG